MVRLIDVGDEVSGCPARSVEGGEDGGAEPCLAGSGLANGEHGRRGLEVGRGGDGVDVEREDGVGKDVGGCGG